MKAKPLLENTSSGCEGKRKEATRNRPLPSTTSRTRSLTNSVAKSFQQNSMMWLRKPVCFLISNVMARTLTCVPFIICKDSVGLIALAKAIISHILKVRMHSATSGASLLSNRDLAAGIVFLTLFLTHHTIHHWMQPFQVPLSNQTVAINCSGSMSNTRKVSTTPSIALGKLIMDTPMPISKSQGVQ